MPRDKTTTAHDQFRHAPLTEADIKAQTDDGSYSRGRSYFRNGHIREPVLRDAAIEALFQGSDFQPYRVRATLLAHGKRGENPRDFSCTCPRGGFCKHIVAMLLTWIDTPEAFMERPLLVDQLTGKSPEELIALIERMVQRYPDLERLVELPLPVTSGDVGNGSPNQVTIDDAVIRKQVRSALAGVSAGDSHYGWGDSWGYGFSVPPELRSLMEVGQSYVTAGQWGNAHVLFAALAGEVLEEAEEWMFTSDEEGELGEVVIECDAALAACLDVQADLAKEDRLSDDAREQVIRSIHDIWHYDVFEFGGYDLAQEGPEAIARNATAAERTKVAGWLRAEQARGVDGWHKRSVVGFLSMLLEAGAASDEEVLALYRDAELWDEVASLLIQMDRIDEAVATAGRHIRVPQSLIEFANALIAHDVALAGRAIALVDDLAWELEGGKAGHELTLQNWLIDHFGRHDRPQEALKLAVRRFERQPSIQNYRSVREMAELPGQPSDSWADVRSKLDDFLREQQVWSVLVDVHLDDGDVAAALDAFDQVSRQREQRKQGVWAPMSWGYEDQELRLARLAERNHPDRAVSIYRQRAEREIQMKSRPNYKVAAGHLSRLRETLERHGRGQEWKDLITEVRSTNKSLRALREELDDLNLR